MNKLNTSHGKWVIAAAIAAALLAGCGGGGGGDSGAGSSGGGSAEARGIDQNAGDLIVFMKGLMALDENSEAVDINPLQLAVDNAGDPAPL